MRLNTRREICKLGKEFHFYPLGDIHLGSGSCDVSLARKIVRQIRDDPLARWIGMGDMGEFIAPNDKRWRANQVDEKIIPLRKQDKIRDVYIEKISELLYPIADKCWAYGDGNHEEKFDRSYYTGMSESILRELGRPELYTEWAAVTRVVFEDDNNHRSSVKIFHSHGWQSGRKDGAKINSLDDLIGYIDGCRICLQGHSHSRLAKTKTKLGTNPGFTKLTQFNSYGAHTGSFLRVYQQNKVNYGEVHGYPPTSLGPLRFNLTPTEKGVGIECIQ